MLKARAGVTYVSSPSSPQPMSYDMNAPGPSLRACDCTCDCACDRVHGFARGERARHHTWKPLCDSMLAWVVSSIDRRQ